MSRKLEPRFPHMHFSPRLSLLSTKNIREFQPPVSKENLLFPIWAYATNCRSARELDGVISPVFFEKRATASFCRFLVFSPTFRFMAETVAVRYLTTRGASSPLTAHSSKAAILRFMCLLRAFWNCGRATFHYFPKIPRHGTEQSVSSG